jgi:ABC-2 type transport system ATP-binding protein
MSMPDPAHYAIELCNVSKIYQQRGKPAAYAVNHLDLSVPAGQVFGFLGNNGAGKTTTIKMICGLIIPTTGTLRVNGYDVARQRAQSSRQIGAVLEGTRNVYWRLSAWQNLMYFGRLKGCPGNVVQERAKRLLSELDLWERRHDSLRFFSRGMQQKVAIACALIADPPVVLLDEPTLGLDVQTSRIMKAWILNLAREQGKTVILTTHQLDIAHELCDHVAIMRQGTLLTNRPLCELLALFNREYYQIKVQGKLEATQISALDDAQVTYEEECTIIRCALPNQEELYAFLDQIRSLALPLLMVSKVEPNLEDVFVHLMEYTTEEKHDVNLAHRS